MWKEMHSILVLLVFTPMTSHVKQIEQEQLYDIPCVAVMSY